MARVLIVEDEMLIALTTKLFLEQLGHEVVGRTNEGPNAVSLAHRTLPDLVLMDITLQGPETGISAARRILAGEGNSRVIFMTAHTDPATLSSAKSAGAAGFLFKPFQIGDLQEALEAVLPEDVDYR